MKSLLLLCTIILYTNMLVFAQDGAPDPTFGGGDGLIYHSIFQNKASQGYGLAIQTDQKIIVSGGSLGPDGHGHSFVSRYNEDGSLDHTFNGTGIIVMDLPGINSYSGAVTVQPDGKIVVSAESSDSTNNFVSVLRFTVDGVPDNSFDGDGKVSTVIESDYLGVGTMELQPDGKIVIGGYAGAALADSFLIVRYLSNGVLDQSFGGDGIVITGVGEDFTDVNGLVVQSDGKIIAAGYATFNGNEDMAIVRYNADGTLDNSFSGDGIAHVTISDHDDRANSVLIQPDSKIVLGGQGYNAITTHSSFGVARLNPDGTLDKTFHGDGIALIYITDFADRSFSIIRQPDGKFVLAGSVYAGAQDFGFMLAVARITENGVLDHTFDGDGVFRLPLQENIESEIRNSILQSDGKIISTGLYRVGFLNQVMLFRSLTGLTTATEEVDQRVTSVSIFPNPITENIVFKYSLEQTERIQISLCNAMGQTVDQLLGKVERGEGNHDEHLALNRNLIPGNYFLKMESDNWVKTFSVIKVKD